MPIEDGNFEIFTCYDIVQGLHADPSKLESNNGVVTTKRPPVLGKYRTVRSSRTVASSRQLTDLSK